MLKIFVIELEFIYTQGCPSFLPITLYNIMVFLSINKKKICQFININLLKNLLKNYDKNTKKWE